MDQVAAARHLVQVVDVLGHDQDVAGPFGLKPGEGLVAGIGAYAKASGVATSSIRTFDQMPSASRKVSSPDSFEIPAPVRITMALDLPPRLKASLIIALNIEDSIAEKPI
jgi:hypothetical protein